MQKNRPTSKAVDRMLKQFAAESKAAKDRGGAKDPGLASLQATIQKRQQKNVHRRSGKK